MKKSKQERRRAVALRYDPAKNLSPEVLAKGESWLGEEIIRLAQEHDIPLYKDPELVNQLMRVETAAEIPPELYESVAVVLAFVYRLDQERRPGA
ncbi:MAG TPA: EscU/YscU/HrcU family type III secretion system export apparatus switch protein [Limnochordia bacterium]|jgi:flagellar biosynthesis protein|nr:EscU/YscU/HrcU family type III secretion system export apparatus switch protein [Bacillota bacterium]HKM17697.1 EscU/YscU/HrcU family type III secretion system export apparatus switch protein [Limnochordia bacterium]